MDCENCGKRIEKPKSRQKYCCHKCRWLAQYKKKKAIGKHTQYYHANKEEIIKKQTTRWSEKYKHDEKFRVKRALRDSSRFRKGKLRNLNGCACSICGAEDDLQRHHPSYESIEYIVVCRICHNRLHYPTEVIHEQG